MSTARPRTNGSSMNHLSAVSWIITALGLLIILTSIVADLSPVWILGGILLTLAGGVKIAVVFIWQRIVGL
ncbi:hypothetical protein BH20CHL2_BH20CHL2_12360 [soil metagenome]